MLSPLVSAQYDQTRSYYASAVTELDSHKVRVQAIHPSATSLNSAFTLKSKLSLMNWGFLSESKESIENEYLAIGLVSGSIQIYSPFSNELLTELIAPDNSAVVDFHYSKLSQTAWSCDISGNVCEWNIQLFSLVQKFNLSDVLLVHNEEEAQELPTKISTTLLDGKLCLLVATQSVYLINAKSKALITKFPAHVQPIHSLISLPIVEENGRNDGKFLTAAHGDRFVNLYSVSNPTAAQIFVTQSPVTSLSFGGNPSEKICVLAAINEDGAVEIFNDALSESTTSGTSASRKKRRHIQSRTSDGSVKVSRPASVKNADTLQLNGVVVDGLVLVISWFENATLPHFDTLQWLDASKHPIITSEIVLEKARPEFSSSRNVVFGHDIAAPRSYNEGNAIVTDGSNTRESKIDSSDEEDEDEQEESLAERLSKISADQNGKSKKETSKKKLGANAAGTLTTILTQALRSNDHSLLETVLTNRDPVIVQKTIARLDSSLAVTFLDRLAERMARQAARFDQLNFWLKWIIIIHGSTISSVPNTSSKLSNLHAVLLRKAEVLPRLLELQGRLNLLNHQVELQREIFETDFDNDSHEESDVEYVEELDDAYFNGDISDDDGMGDLRDDYQDDYEEEEEEEEDLDINEEEEIEEKNERAVTERKSNTRNGYAASNGEVEEEGYSDVEIGVNNDLMDEDTED